MLYKIRRFLISLVLYSFALVFCINSFPKSALAGETEVLQYLSCEGGFAADLLNYGSPYSCIREPLLDQMVTGLLTLGMSVAMTTRLKMHNNQYSEGCKRENRADYDNPKIDFGLCNNVRLIAMNVWQALSGAAENLITGDLDNIDNLIPDPSEYVFDFSNTGPGFYSVFADVRLVPIPVKVQQLLQVQPPPYIAFVYNVDTNQDRICVNILTMVGAFMPVGCKYIKEPFPRSIYETYGAQEVNATRGNDISMCNSVYNCSEKAKTFSRTLIPIISPIISCVREMILRLVISTEVCNPTKITGNTESNLAKAFAAGISGGSMVHKFQIGMQSIVTGLLTLYVIFFGFKIALGGKVKQSELVNFIIKFLLVSYFSIGINMKSGGATMRFDGMTQWIFPFMLNGVTQIAGWMITSGATNGLCDFSGVTYDPTADISMALWDQIDCRLAYYIGYDGLIELLNPWIDDPVKHHIPPYVFLIIPGIIAGNMDLIMLALMYPIMVVSFVAYTMCMFVSSLILILILGILAPIFVPCALFSQTNDYFQKWWKNLFGLILQPAIALTFLSMMFTVYDRGFYGTCKYRSVNVTNPKTNKINLSFFISDDAADYPGGQEEFNICTSSMGYFFNNPTSTLFGGGSSGVSGNPTINPKSPEMLAAMNQTDEQIMSGDKGKPKLKWKDGILTQSPKMIWQELMGLIKNFIMCFILLTVLKNLMESMNDFIMRMSGSEISSQLIGATAVQGAADKVSQKASASVEKAGEKIRQGISKVKDAMNKGKEASNSSDSSKDESKGDKNSSSDSSGSSSGGK